MIDIDYQTQNPKLEEQEFDEDNPNKFYAVKVIDRKRIRGKNHELLVNEIEIMTEI